MSKKLKVYVASSWRNEFQPDIVSHLRQMGCEVYDFKNPHSVTGIDYGTEGKGFHWSDLDPEDPNWRAWPPEKFRKLLDHPLAKSGFASDKAAMEWADVFVLLMPCGRSAHLEAGWAVGQGKPTAIFLDRQNEPELMYKFADVCVTSTFELESWIRVNQKVNRRKPESILDARIDNEECDEDNLPTLREAIRDIGGENGWWKSYSEESFQKAAIMLGNKGMHPQDIYFHLSAMYSAVSACYGN